MALCLGIPSSFFFLINVRKITLIPFQQPA